MKTASTFGFGLFAMLVGSAAIAACSDPAVGPIVDVPDSSRADSSVAADSGTVVDANRPDTAIGDTGIADTGLADTGADTGLADTGADSGLADSGADSGPVVAPTWTQVRNALAANCASCHTTGGRGGHNIGQANLVGAYADAKRVSINNGVCPGGITIAACSSLRARNGTMPAGGVANPVLANLIDAWIAGGMVGP